MTSIRLRVTAVAVAVTAAALALGGWALVRAVERTQIAKVAADVEERVDLIADRLRAGAPPGQAFDQGAAPIFGVVQVIDNASGDVVGGAPGVSLERPILVTGGSMSAQDEVVSGLVATGAEGSATVEDPLPGPGEQATRLQLRYETVQAGGRDLTVVAASPLTEVTRSIDTFQRSLWIALPAVVALVGGIAWMVTGRALRPVEAMRAEVESISHSTLHRRVPNPGADDEVGRLARTMNDMLDRLEGSAERQQRFVADASHELRSPVAALRTELEVALRAGEERTLRAAVEGALAEEARLEDLLADLLLLAAVEEAAPVRSDVVDLATVATVEAERARRVPVVVTGDGVVAGSASQLRRVVANLLDNAARHARSAVAVQVDGGRLVVDDDGPGIPAADRERVFERFTRLDEGRTRDGGGAGLGLSLVRAVVTAHGGRAWAEAAPTGGARLVVELPPAAMIPG